MDSFCIRGHISYLDFGALYLGKQTAVLKCFMLDIQVFNNVSKKGNKGIQVRTPVGLIDYLQHTHHMS